MNPMSKGALDTTRSTRLLTTTTSSGVSKSGSVTLFAGSSRSSGKVGNHPENHPHIIRSEQVGKCDPLCRIIKQFRKGWQPSRKPSSPKNNPMKFSHSTSWLEVSPVEQAPLKIADEVHPLDFMTRKFTFSSSMVAAHPSQGVGKQAIGVHA